MLDLTTFTWQLPVAVGLVYLASFATDRLIHLLEWLGGRRAADPLVAGIAEGNWG